MIGLPVARAIAPYIVVDARRRDDAAPDEGFLLLDEIFHLEDQLAAVTEMRIEQ